MTIISTHALTWSATGIPLSIHDEYEHFNSRAHVERDVRAVRRRPAIQHFNSRAHVERDSKPVRILDTDGYISTHALTWSATGSRLSGV